MQYAAERKKQIRVECPAERPRPSEHQEQVAVIMWWAYACASYGMPDFALYAVPNGSARHIVVASKLKAEGVRGGIPDLFLASPSLEFHGLYIEMKSVGGSVKKKQREVGEYLKSQGYCVAVCYSAEAAVKTIKEYLA